MPLSAIWISIHALRVEGDLLRSLPQSTRMAISIHALRVEGDNYGKLADMILGISIHALRVEGDPGHAGGVARRIYFYPRPPGGGRLQNTTPTRRSRIFLSTPSGWRATVSAPGLLPFSQNFYPRPPGGGRRMSPVSVFSIRYFYPRPPGGGRRHVFGFFFCCGGISIHALRVEGDASRSINRIRMQYFYPRPPGGGRQPRGEYCIQISFISIHALRVEGDRRAFAFRRSRRISIHALRVEGDVRRYDAKHV